MFDPNAHTSYLGLAIANNKALKGANRDTVAAREDANAMSSGAVALAVALQAARAEIARLEDALAVKTAHAEGATAMFHALTKQHPDSPLLVDSGKRYKDGDIKRKIRLIYEAAHDACLAKMGIANPASCRAD